MQNKVHDGNILTVTAPYDLKSGDGCLVGEIFGVAEGDYSLGDTETQIDTRGVFTLPKDGSNFTQDGVKVFWDDGAKKCTATVGSNKLIGLTEGAAGASATKVNVWLLRNVGGLVS